MIKTLVKLAALAALTTSVFAGYQEWTTTSLTSASNNWNVSIPAAVRLDTRVEGYNGAYAIVYLNRTSAPTGNVYNVNSSGSVATASSNQAAGSFNILHVVQGYNGNAGTALTTATW